jgi:hypothetical protein
MGDYINQINEQNLKKDKFNARRANIEYVEYLK